MTAPVRCTALMALVLVPATAVAATSGQSSTRTTPRLTASPVDGQPGETVTLEGSGFPRNVHVALMAGPPHAEATRIGGAQTGPRGRFVATIHIRPRSSAAAFVALACHDDCRVKASARFRIVDP